MTNPIGIFDSGVGGTSIWKEINSLLPNENTIYLSDSKNAPYGEKSKSDILKLCKKNTELLLEKKCKIIVVACNTATTNAISFLRQNYKVPFIGIEPAIKPASIATKTNKIGVLATKGTLTSELFYKTSSLIDDNVEIIEQIGFDLVELIENGEINSLKMELKLREQLNNLTNKNIDCLVLGCTHFPYLIPQIRKIIGSKIKIIDSGFAVAKQVKKVLADKNLLSKQEKTSKHQFYINKNKKYLKKILNSSNQNICIEELQF